MRLRRVEVLHRERFGNHALVRYRWFGEPPEPGQFVMARASADTQSLDPFLCRPFFAHDHEDGTISLLLEVRGRGTTLLAAGGDEMLVSDPRGRGFSVAGEGPVALVGGGVWVAPLGLLSRRLSASGVEHDVYLELPETAPEAYGAWVSRRYAGANFVPTDGSPGGSRRLFGALGDPDRYAAVYVSGSRETLAAARELATTATVELAVRERMACADGSCHGCAVAVRGGMGHARACVEGPVFRAEDLAW